MSGELYEVAEGRGCSNQRKYAIRTFPRFYAEYVDAWEFQVNLYFHYYGVTNQDKKKSELVCGLPSSVLEKVLDVALTESSQPYDDLMTAIKKRGMLKEECLHLLTSHQKYFDRKPSSFLRRLRQLSDDPDSITKSYFYSFLPSDVAYFLNLIAPNDTLDEAAQRADRVHIHPISSERSYNTDTQPSYPQIPPFYKEDIGVWWFQVENYFKIFEITSEIEKKVELLLGLSAPVLTEIIDKVNTQSEHPYEDLIFALNNRLAMTNEECLSQLLSAENKGAMKPTKFLRKLRSLTGSPERMNDLLKFTFFSLYPKSMKILVNMFFHKSSLEQVAEIAERAFIDGQISIPHLIIQAFEAMRVSSTQSTTALSESLGEVERFEASQTKLDNKSSDDKLSLYFPNNDPDNDSTHQLGNGFDRLAICTSEQVFDYILVLDFESTCWKGVPPVNAEIIEFPVILLDLETGEHVAQFREFVKPSERPILSTFCTNFTGITQQQVDRGLPIGSCLAGFDRWLKDTKRDFGFNLASSSSGRRSKLAAFATWSDWDLGTCLKRECERKGISKPGYFERWIDARAIYKDFYKRKPKGLVGALQDLGLQFEGREHSGLCDARNTAKLLDQMVQDGCVLEITKDLSPTNSGHAAPQRRR